MSSHKIIAYFIHKSDTSFIKSHLTIEQETESFFIGDATTEQQELLEQRNIIFNVLDSPSPDKREAFYIKNEIRELTGSKNLDFQMLDSPPLLCL